MVFFLYSYSYFLFPIPIKTMCEYLFRTSPTPPLFPSHLHIPPLPQPSKTLSCPPFGSAQCRKTQKTFRVRNPKLPPPVKKTHGLGSTGTSGTLHRKENFFRIMGLACFVIRGRGPVRRLTVLVLVDFPYSLLPSPLSLFMRLHFLPRSPRKCCLPPSFLLPSPLFFSFSFSFICSFPLPFSPDPQPPRVLLPFPFPLRFLLSSTCPSLPSLPSPFLRFHSLSHPPFILFFLLSLFPFISRVQNDRNSSI